MTMLAEPSRSFARYHRWANTRLQAAVGEHEGLLLIAFADGLDDAALTGLGERAPALDLIYYLRALG